MASDEAIDLIYRIFCEPNKSSALIISPSYGMYSVAAEINAVEIIKYRLEENFGLDARKMLSLVREDTKVIFICSPNNPSGNLLSQKEIEYVIDNFDGIVVVDEAYIDFAGSSSFSRACKRKKKFGRTADPLQTLRHGRPESGHRHCKQRYCKDHE